MDEKTFKQSLLDQLYTPYKENSSALKYAPTNSVVFGEGNPNALLMIIGEAPGEQEDKMGRPFVGRSGTLLNKALEAVGITRQEIFITNIVKCRPPNNRKPTQSEMKTHRQLLMDQIKVIRPKILCTLGASALEGLLGEAVKITQRRGTIIEWNGTLLIPTYHPAYILRNPKEITTLLSDLQKAVDYIQKEY